MNTAHDSICAVAVVAVPVAAAAPAATSLPPRSRTLGECIVAACDRDPDAAEVVANRLRPRLLEQIEKALGDRAQDAEDVLDSLFVEILDGGVTIADVDSPVKCLMRVARNFARRYLRELRGNWGIDE
jgi:DNA-directed RNA polymerase specialized sigma24 family protein